MSLCESWRLYLICLINRDTRPRRQDPLKYFFFRVLHFYARVSNYARKSK